MSLAAFGLYASPALAAGGGPYASCAAVKAANPGAPDGTYPILVGSTTVAEYCSGLSGVDPRGYLTLVSTGPGKNFSHREPFGHVNTTFTKIRLVPNGGVVDSATCAAAVCVDTTDLTFSTSTGYSLFGDTMPYAQAAGCGGPDGTANVDLTGTNLSVAPNASVSGGYNQWGSATYGSGNQVVNLIGNGSCGDESSATAPLLPLVVVPGTLKLWLHASPSSALLDVQAVLSIGGVTQGPTIALGLAGGGNGPGGSALATIPVPLTSGFSSGKKLRLDLSVRNGCASSASSAVAALFFNTSAANSSLQFPAAGPTYYLAGGSGDQGSLSTGFDSMKLLTKSVGSAGKCGSFRPLGTFTSS